MMESCKEIRIGAYADGELSQAEAAQVEAHIATCEQCRDELKRVRGISAAVAGFSPRISSPAINRMRMAAVSAAESARFKRLGRIAAGLVGIAACLAVTGMIMSFGSESPSKKISEVATVEETLADETPVSVRDSSVAEWMVAGLSGARGSEVTREH